VTKRARILLVDDQVRARQSLRALLSTWPCLQSVWEAADALEAIRQRWLVGALDTLAQPRHRFLSVQHQVYVYIPDRYSTTAQARYWISHAGGLTLRIVNQSAFSNQWVSLGTYRFQGNSNDYVSLADVTFEPYLSRLIAFDAVKWVPR